LRHFERIFNQKVDGMTDGGSLLFSTVPFEHSRTS